MKTATVHELKAELKHLPPAKLVDICLRLARFKNENKELLTYLLFEAHDEQAFVNSVKAEMDERFNELREVRKAILGYTNLYLVKKGLRKTLRMIGKYARFSGSKHAEVQLRMHFCAAVLDARVPLQRHAALSKLYDGELKKIDKALGALHEDLQYDYQAELARLREAS